MGLPLVLCYAAQRTVLGCVVAEQGGHSQVLTFDGAEVQIRQDQTLFRWDHPVSARDHPPGVRERPALVAYLSARFRELERRAAALSLDGLAAALPAGEVFTLDEAHARLSTAGAGAAPAAMDVPWEQAALCLALTRDRERFRREGAGFVTLDAAERARRLARESSARDAEHWANLARTWGPELAQGRWSGAESSDGPEFLARLWSLAAHERHSPHWNTLGRALGLHQSAEASIAHRLKPRLDAAHAWQGWPELWLERAAVRRHFPDEALAEAVRIAALGVDRAKRVDRRKIGVFTIDAAGTFDYDDAYSLESAGAALFANVHIAEPHRDLVPGNPVFDEAARRISSVYSEAGLFPMLPPALSLGRFSLMRGRAREVLTFRFRITEGGPEWIGLERSIIEVRDNLDYSRAGQLVAQDAAWGRLALACERQAQDRERRGAHLEARTDVQLDISDPARVGLALTRRAGPVQRIVEELAIAYNAAAGALCRDSGLPALYRIQSGFSPGGSVSADRSAGGRASARAHFSIQGGPHEGLACERYVQVTSPNRRFADLLMQRQLIAHASGRSGPFSREQLRTWGEHAEGRLAAHEEAERNIQEHWVRVWLTQHPGTSHPGTVRRSGDGSTRVWLDELALPAEAVQRLDAGQRLTFRVVSVDVDRQRVHVAPA